MKPTEQPRSNVIAIPGTHTKGAVAQPQPRVPVNPNLAQGGLKGR